MRAIGKIKKHKDVVAKDCSSANPAIGLSFVIGRQWTSYLPFGLASIRTAASKTGELTLPTQSGSSPIWKADVTQRQSEVTRRRQAIDFNATDQLPVVVNRDVVPTTIASNVFINPQLTGLS